MRFRRSEDIYLTRNIQFNCTDPFFNISIWTVSSCPSACSTEVQLNQSIATAKNDLFIPAYTLNHGHYQLQLTVTTLTSSVLNTTSLIDIDILPMNIITRLLSVDTSTIIHHDQQDLVFDPGRYSIDPTANIFDSDVSS